MIKRVELAEKTHGGNKRILKCYKTFRDDLKDYVVGVCIKGGNNGILKDFDCRQEAIDYFDYLLNTGLYQES